MRRYISYIILCAAALIGVGAATAPVIENLNPDLAYADGRTLYFKASHYVEGSLDGNYSDFLDSTDLDASGNPVIEELADEVSSRLDNWGMSEYEVKSEGYDTIAVSLRAADDSETQYTYLQQYLAFSGGDYALGASDTTHDDYPDADVLDDLIDGQEARIENIDMGQYKVPVVVVPLQEGDEYKEAFLNLIEYCVDNTTKDTTNEETGETTPGTTTLLVVWANRQEGDEYSLSESDANVASRILTVESAVGDNAVWYAESDEDQENPQLQLIPASSAITDDNYNPEMTKEAYEAAVFLRNMVNASSYGDYRLSYTYSEPIKATVESLVTLGDYAITPAFGRTLICVLVSFAVLAIILALFDRIFALTHLSTMALTVFASLATFMAFGSQFNIAALLGLALVTGISLFGSVFYSSRMKDELYKGRTLKKANQEAAKKSFWPTVDAGIVSIILGIFVYFFAGDLASKAGIVLVFGGFFATLANLIFTRISAWLLGTDSYMQAAFPKQLHVDANKLPDVLKEEKQSYFGPFANHDFSKGKWYVTGLSILFVLAGIGTMLGFGIANSGNIYNDAAYRQEATVLHLDVRSDDADSITVDALSGLDTIRGEDANGNPNLLSAIKIDDQVLDDIVSDAYLSESPKAVYETADAGEGRTYYWYYYEIRLSKYFPLLEDNGADATYSVSFAEGLDEEGNVIWGAPQTLSLNDAVTTYISSELVAEENFYSVSFATAVPTVSQPDIGVFSLGLGLGILVAGVYTVLRYRPSRGLTVMVLSAVTAYISLAFFVFTRMSVTPLVALGSLGSALVVYLLFLFLGQSEKDLAAASHDKTLTVVEIRRDAANKAASRQAGSIFLIALSLAYVALIFFAFGPTAFAYPYLNFLLGIFFAVALLLCVYPLLEMALVSLFAKIKIKPRSKKKKKVGGQLLKKKGNEPEEAIFIGIND